MIKRFIHEIGRSLRETGIAMDRAGLAAVEKPLFKEPFARHRAVMNLYEKHPQVSPGVFVAPNASVIGRVSVQYNSAIWYGAVVRGDLSSVVIGGHTSVQDRAVIHTSKSVEGKLAADVVIGDHVIIGPGAILHSCTVESHAKIGAGAIVGEGALVEEFAHVAEGAVVHPGRRIPAGQLWAGNPAQFVRQLTQDEMAATDMEAEELIELAHEHSTEFLPHSTVYQHAEAVAAASGSSAAASASAASSSKAH